MAAAHRSRSNEGFTLIEIMIAMTVLLIGFVGVLALQISLTRESSFSRHTVEASMVGEHKMEELFAMPEAQMVAGTDLVNSLGEITAASPTPPEYMFTRAWTVDRTDPELTTVTVSVTWSERGDDYTIGMTSQRLVEN